VNPYSSRLVTANGTAALATVMLGVMAGFFWTYSFNVNYATLELSADDYARMQSLFNVNVRHGMFFSVFFGAAVASTAAVIANLPYRRTASFWCLVVACCAYVFGICIRARRTQSIGAVRQCPAPSFRRRLCNAFLHSLNR